MHCLKLFPQYCCGANGNITLRCEKANPQDHTALANLGEKFVSQRPTRKRRVCCYHLILLWRIMQMQMNWCCLWPFCFKGEADELSSTVEGRTIDHSGARFQMLDYVGLLCEFHLPIDFGAFGRLQILCVGTFNMFNCCSSPPLKVNVLSISYPNNWE